MEVEQKWVAIGCFLFVNTIQLHGSTCLQRDRVRITNNAFWTLLQLIMPYCYVLWTSDRLYETFATLPWSWKSELILLYISMSNCISISFHPHLCIILPNCEPQYFNPPKIVIRGVHTIRQQISQKNSARLIIQPFLLGYVLRDMWWRKGYYLLSNEWKAQQL